MVTVRPDGAFSVNCIGVERAPFPLSFSTWEAEGCRIVQAAAVQASELADVLAAAAGDTVVVLDLWTNSFVNQDNTDWPASQIAASQGVECAVHRFGALATLGLGDEGIVIGPDDLAAFLDGWSPYDLSLVGLPARPDAGQLDEIGLAVGTADHSRPLLPHLPGCHLWYSGHDDCYLWVESTDAAIPAAILARLLTLYVGAALIEAVDPVGAGAPAGTGPVEVAEPDRALVDELTAAGPHWIGSTGDVSPERVTVRLAATTATWRLGDPVPERVDRVAVYDVAGARWRLGRP